MKALASKFGPRSLKEAAWMFAVTVGFAAFAGLWVMVIGLVLTAITFALIVWMARHDPRTGDL